MLPRLSSGLEYLSMDDVLVAQVVDDDPVRQRARLVHHRRRGDDRCLFSVEIVHGFR